LPQSEAEASDWLIFSGRFHPLVIHFPIVLFFVLLLLEGLYQLGWVEKQPMLQWLLLGLTALSSLLAVGIGLALYRSGVTREQRSLYTSGRAWQYVCSPLAVG